MLDLLGELRRIMNADAGETFDPATDSLEAIRGLLAATGSAVLLGICDPAMGASVNTILCPNLSGYPDDTFSQRFSMMVLRNAPFPGFPPEGEVRAITGYVGATGQFTTDNFSIAVEANSLVLVISESLLSVERRLRTLELDAPSLTELWETEAIDLNLWTPTHPATNPLIVVTDAAPYQAMHVVRFDIEDAENGLLQGRVNRNRWRVMPNLVSSHFMPGKFVMEFEIYHNDVAHIDQTMSFFGLVTDPADYTRVDNNIVGFRYDGLNQLMSITDNGGGEMSVGIAEVIEDIWHKLRIEVSAGMIQFFVNGVLRTEHNMAAMLPDQLMYPSFYFASAGGGADTFEVYLGGVRLGYEVML